MIIGVNGKAHRLFFQHEEVPTRYRGKAKSPVTQRTVCRLEIKGETVDENGKPFWMPIAEGVAYRNHTDAPRKSDGIKHSFAAMMKVLANSRFIGYSAAVRAEIAAQFLTSRPKRLTAKDLKAIIRQKDAEIERLKATIKGLED